MICNKCGKTINDGAKFCKFCGASVQSAPQTVAASKAEITCPSCGKTLSAGAKFCKFCGISLNASPVETNQEAAPDSSMKNDRNIDQITNFVTWHIMPEQIAVKIDEKEIAAYKTIKGVYVTPGTKALFFVNGKYAASLDSGTYSFKDFVNESPSNAPTTTKPHPVLDFFKKIGAVVACNPIGAERDIDATAQHGGNSRNTACKFQIAVRIMGYADSFFTEDVKIFIGNMDRVRRDGFTIQHTRVIKHACRGLAVFSDALVVFVFGLRQMNLHHKPVFHRERAECAPQTFARGILRVNSGIHQNSTVPRAVPVAIKLDRFFCAVERIEFDFFVKIGDRPRDVRFHST